MPKINDFDYSSLFFRKNYIKIAKIYTCLKKNYDFFKFCSRFYNKLNSHEYNKDVTLTLQAIYFNK